MSDSGVPTITDLGELITLIQGLLNVEYSAVASLTFIVWDIVITFDQEVEYIWSQPARSPLKWLFIFARYFTVIVQIIFALDYIGVLQVWGGNLPVCQAWFTLQSLAIQAVTSTTEAMLMMRVYALYNRNRKVRCGLVVLFASELLAIIPMFAIAIPRMEFTVICTPIASHYSLLFFSWLVTVALGVQSILLALTLNPTLRAIRDGWGRTPIFLTMARDGGWSFLLQFVILFLNILISKLLGGFEDSAVLVWQMTILSFASCRLVLNLYDLRPHPPSGTDVQTTETRFSTNLSPIRDSIEMTQTSPTAVTNSRYTSAEDSVESPTSDGAAPSPRHESGPTRPCLVSQHTDRYTSRPRVSFSTPNEQSKRPPRVEDTR